MTLCQICLADVEPASQEEHLRAVHPAPSAGFRFFYDGAAFFTFRPSMTVGDLLEAVGGNVTYLFHEERDGKQIPLAHGNAVDLTREPRFFSVPPATY